MSYQALLFCPDEKTARVVSQVLSELEFTVEPCHEPFAAVKKLMVQHFDAIVVDCDNEQNAALLFKSARNSGSNQASLAVAVVEGQAGVAKAFRLGANLVLTKPIHVEQSKGTLRVARGLLRKGQAAKAAAATPTAGPPTMFTPPSVPASFPPPQKSAAPPSASASAFELDAEPCQRPMQPTPRCSSTCRTLRFPAPRIRRGLAAESDPSKQYPWQPRKPLAEPMASALRRAAEAAGKSEFDAAAPRSTAASQPVTPQATTPQTTVSQSGMATAGFAQTKRRGRRTGPGQGNSRSRCQEVRSGTDRECHRRAFHNRRDRNQEDRRSIRERRLAIRTQPSVAAEAPSFHFARWQPAGFGLGRQQEDPADRGVGARTRSRRLFRLDQDAVCASPTSSAAIGRSCQPGDGCPAAAAHGFGPRDATRDGRGGGTAAGPRFEWDDRRSFYIQAFGRRDCGGPGHQDTGAGQSDVRGR